MKLYSVIELVWWEMFSPIMVMDILHNILRGSSGEVSDLLNVDCICYFPSFTFFLHIYRFRLDRKTEKVEKYIDVILHEYFLVAFSLKNNGQRKHKEDGNKYKVDCKVINLSEYY